MSTRYILSILQNIIYMGVCWLEERTGLFSGLGQWGWVRLMGFGFGLEFMGLGAVSANAPIRPILNNFTIFVTLKIIVSLLPRRLSRKIIYIL